MDRYSRSRHGSRRRLPGRVVFLLVALSILLLSGVITAVLSKKHPEEAPVIVPDSGVVSELLAPLPMMGGFEQEEGLEPASTLIDLYGPAAQSPEDYSLVKYQASVIRQPEIGSVDLSYFSDAAFLGDSLTEGLSTYDINVGGALVCGYIGIGPDSVYNRATVKHPQRGEEVALDVLAEAQPKKLYILLGTNTLTTMNMEERFLKYYDEMLDALRAALGEDCLIYVQAIPPVRPEVSAEKVGLLSANVRKVNERLAQMAVEKGCVYLDLWEALADSDGDLNKSYAAPDGIHLTPGKGYGAWVNYLRTHTRYAADSPWIGGSPFEN